MKGYFFFLVWAVLVPLSLGTEDTLQEVVVTAQASMTVSDRQTKTDTVTKSTTQQTTTKGTTEKLPSSAVKSSATNSNATKKTTEAVLQVRQKSILSVQHPRIESFRNRYVTKHGRDYLAKIMARSTLYRSFIVSELKKAGLPPELLFLPVIESGFYEKALSKSGAVGVWQFMRNSIGGFDIYIDDWRDERRDPWKTTIAAIKKLKWNYQALGNWHLALAAYNGGLGAVSRAVKRAGKADFWYLADHGYLRKETALYVPKFIAIAQILQNSEVLGINWSDGQQYIETCTISVKRAIDLQLLAKKMECSADILCQLNPALLYNITPPNAVYPLRIPNAYKQKCQAVLAQKKSLLIKYYVYRIRAGDTLLALARHYGVTVKTLLRSNPRVRARSLQINQKILIPALKSVAPYRRKKQKRTVARCNGTHIVKKGDTLWALALRYNIDVEMLAENNHLKLNAILSLGMKLKVPIQE